MTSYETLLNGMWAPEGSEINDRLRRLQELEQMRKDREAKRQEILKNRGERTTGVITRTARVRSTATEPETEMSRLRIRRTTSMRDDSEDKENFGGARPKVGGYSSGGESNATEDWGNLFSDIKASIIAPRRNLKTDRDYTSTTRSAFERPTFTSKLYSDRPAYTSKYSNSEKSEDTSIFADIRKSVLGQTSVGLKGKTFTTRTKDIDTQSNTVVPGSGFRSYRSNNIGGYSSLGQENGHTAHEGQNGKQAEEEHHEEEEEDEEPKYFIERLKNRGNDSQSPVLGTRHNEFAISSIPSVPPYRKENGVIKDQYSDIPELVQPTEEIITVAQNINSIFGAKSPEQSQLSTPSYKSSVKSGNAGRSERKRKSPTKSMTSEGKVPEDEVEDNGFIEDPNASVTYELQEQPYDSDGDEEGRTLPVSESLYKAGSSEWVLNDESPNKLDRMHEFFTGQPVGEDPNISRELDGEKIKAELNKSYHKEAKTPKRTAPSTPKSSKKMRAKTPPRVKTPVDKVKKSKGGKSSSSENESVQNSEGELDGKKGPNAGSTSKRNGTSAKSDHHLSIGDKLAKLETLTQEKRRKQSNGENEVKKAQPSYMSSTNASQKKKARGKDGSPQPSSHDLKKDVRELKQFIREQCSEPNTPISSPTKLSFERRDSFTTDKKVTREISVQTDIMIDIENGYVCKHCGKSSNEEAIRRLTQENLNKELYNGKKDTTEKAKGNNHNKISSKDSVKSLGEMSAKSDKSTSSRKINGGGTSSYMKGTTSSRLKTNPTGPADKNRKNMTPEMMLYSSNEPTSLKGTVSQRTKTFENAGKEKAKPSFSIFRAVSVDRNKHESKQSRMKKSKSVDQVNVLKGVERKPDEISIVNKKDIIDGISKESVDNSMAAPASPGEKRSHAQISQKDNATEPLEVESLNEEVQSPRSPRSPTRSSRSKPPLVSPKPTPLSPRHVDLVGEAESVESKGQFTTIVDNPFIKNDTRRRNSFKGREKGESVWEKAEIRSRDSSLKRSNSTSSADRGSRNSSLQRSNTSVGEKSSLGQLSWSDSGSTGSMNKSRSSHHGSNSHLDEVFDRQEKNRSGSTSSQGSHNAMLNLLTPMNPVSGALETDVDAVYEDHVKDNDQVDEHNEESVNKTHLEFAKQACNVLELDVKKRDSSNESDKGGKTDSNAPSSEIVNTNGHGNEQQMPVPSQQPNQGSKKGKKGFLKGKLFRK